MATSLLRNRETQSTSPTRMKNLTTTTEQGPLKQRHRQQEKQGPKQNLTHSLINRSKSYQINWFCFTERVCLQILQWSPVLRLSN